MSLHIFSREVAQTSCHDLEAKGEVIVSAIPDAFGSIVVLTQDKPARAKATAETRGK